MSKRRWHCVGCKRDTIAIGHYYMVHDDVWAATGLEPHGGMLCLDCLAERLGRAVTFDDFSCMWPTARLDEMAAEAKRRMAASHITRTINVANSISQDTAPSMSPSIESRTQPSSRHALPQRR